MKKFVASSSLILVVIGFVVAAPTREHKEFSIEGILDKIPEDERINFLKYHLQLGYELEKKQAAWPNALPEDFATKLYEYAKQNFQILEKSKLKKARAVVCFEDGTCIDTGDIGVHPL